MLASRVLFVCLALASVTGCDGMPIPSVPTDAGRTDAGTPSREDAGEGDADVVDAGTATDDAGSVDAAMADAGRPCSTALRLVPAEGWAQPTGIVTFSVEGGSGSVRFDLAESPSGARIEASLGIYSAGDLPDTIDTVRATDLGCDGVATAQVHVVRPLAAMPMTAEVPPMGAIQLAPEGGSGMFDYAMFRARSGGTVDASGRYVAGAVEGRDVVRVRDRQTGVTSDSTIDVRVSAGMLRPGASAVGVPEGSTFALPITGGSGVYDGSSTDESIARVVGGIVEGLAPGTVTITVRDRFTGATTPLGVEVMAPSGGGSIDRVGDALELQSIATADVNGDGFIDVALGQADNDRNGQDAGAVVFYLGNATGLEPVPARVIVGELRGHRMGASVLLVDATNDGRIDLLVGAPRGDGVATLSGTVGLYPGAGDGTFAASPSRVFTGPFGSDEMATSMTACDFNDDGAMDLAFGAPEGEDRLLVPQQASQGAVHVYLGRGRGTFPIAADTVVYGVIPVPAVPGTWEARGATRMGGELASGDVDGDGVCDLVAHVRSPWAGQTPARTEDGAIAVFRGVAADPSRGRVGGPESIPARMVAGAPRDAAAAIGASRLGISLAVADLDGDGRAEIVAGQTFEDFPMLSDAGAVRVFAGGVWDAPRMDVELAATAAVATVAGGRPGGQTGRDVAVADLNADGRPDLVVGSPVAERTGTPTPPGDTGLVDVLLQGDPALSFTLHHTLNGPLAGDRLGQLVEPLHDLDGDGLRDVVSYAFLDDRQGWDVGALYTVPSAEGGVLTPYDIPGTASGALLGRGVDIVGDVLGADGFPEIVAGCEGCDRVAPLASVSRSTGRALLYRGTATGYDLEAPVTLEAFVGHNGGDGLGNAVSRIGRFDNADGVADFAVVARNGDRAVTLPTGLISSAGTTTCGPALSNSGAVHIFRGVGAGGSITRPAFIYYPPYAGGTVESVAGDVDVNGDGFDDLIIGTRLADPTGSGAALNDAGTVSVLFGGRVPDAMGRTVVICAADLVREGDIANLQAGASVAGVPDINGDGCDEVAIGLRNLSTPGQASAGGVDVMFGFRRMTDTASPACPLAPSAVRLSPQLANSIAGSSVAGGDVDGDGRGDLLVGAPGHRLGAFVVGRAYLVRGAYVNVLRSSVGVQPLSDPTGPPVVVEGTGALDAVGTSVAFVPGISAGGRDGIAVSAVADGLTGTRLTGSVRIHRVTSSAAGVAIEAVPFAIVGSESSRRSHLFGEVVRVFRGPARTDVVTGAPLASGVSTEWGAAYVMPVARR